MNKKDKKITDKLIEKYSHLLELLGKEVRK